MEQSLALVICYKNQPQCFMVQGHFRDTVNTHNIHIIPHFRYSQHNTSKSQLHSLVLCILFYKPTNTCLIDHVARETDLSRHTDILYESLVHKD